MLQETCRNLPNPPLLNREWFKHPLCTAETSKARGVAMLTAPRASCIPWLDKDAVTIFKAILKALKIRPSVWLQRLTRGVCNRSF